MASISRETERSLAPLLVNITHIFIRNMLQLNVAGIILAYLHPNDPHPMYQQYMHDCIGAGVPRLLQPHLQMPL